MRVRTGLILLLAIAAATGGASLYNRNREIVQTDFRFWGDASLPVGQALLLFLFAGMLIMFFLQMAREFGLMMERRRQRKAGRKADEIEEEYSRALVAILEGRDEDSLGHFRAVLERDSRHFNTLLKLGEVLRNQGQIAEAIEYHRKAHHIREDDHRPLYDLVEDYEAKGDMDRARAVLGKIIALKKQSVSAWRKLRSLNSKQGRWEKALEAQKQVEKFAGKAGPGAMADRHFGQGIRFEIGLDALRVKNFKEATAIFRRSLKEDSLFVPAHLALGHTLIEQGQDSGGVQAWYNGFELTGAPIILTTLEEHFLQREEPLGAIEALKHCIAGTRKDTIPRFYLGKLYFRLEMLDDAMAVLSSLEGRASYAPNLYYLIGKIHERRRNHADAAAEYRRVIREMELIQLEYICGHCGASFMEWSGRCESCHFWNQVNVNFVEEIPIEELGVSPAPIYTD